MRASRAYIAGFGTTGVLVASSLLLLAVVSALVAFRGWPDTGFAENISSLVVDEPGRVEVDGPVQVAQNAPVAAAAVAQSPVPGTAAAGGAVPGSLATAGDVRSFPVTGEAQIPVGPGTGEGTTLLSEPTDRTVSPPSAAEPPGGLLPETPLTPQVNRVARGLGDSTQGLTDNLGQTVGQLNPQLGQTLTQTGQTLAELLRSLGQPAR
jgi:hypothetical protein